MSQTSLYERLGGASATAAVIDQFPVAQNPAGQASPSVAPTEALVLAVDDDPATRRLMALELGAEGFRVLTASTGEQALAIVETQRPDVVLLDVVMPQMSGYDVLRALKERESIPVIFVSALSRDCDKVRGLELGAEDYVVKPYGADELAARIRAVLRRAAGVTSRGLIVQAGDIAVDLDRRLVQRSGEQVLLTRSEWHLLQHLALNADKVILRDALLTKVWGPEYSDEYEYLRVWVSRLRRKLEADPSKPKVIKTLPGIGYVFESSVLPTFDHAETRAASRTTA